MDCVRNRITIRGAVQGVGFRPFLYRLARELELVGLVRNSSAGVVVEVEGVDSAVTEFRRRLEEESPAYSEIENVAIENLVLRGGEVFSIEQSSGVEGESTVLLPDLAPCPACLEEMRDPRNRRFRYPFLTCTDCGPRFSIAEALPFDRCRTAMSRFPMCPECEREYSDPNDRRFHAQTSACSECGPMLTLLDPGGQDLAHGEEALRAAVEALRSGKIVAVKSVGGFQLLADARREEIVRRLRVRKQREAKPFAVVVGNLSRARELCSLSDTEERLLCSSEAPIVLASAREGNGIAESVAPENPRLGLMLPPSPLHALILDDLGHPLVATSGNRSGEPIAIDEAEALDRLSGIADLILSHDRPVLRPVDDSVVQEVCGEEQVLRRARGYAPLPIAMESTFRSVLGLGAHLKNTVAVGTGSHVFVGQHIGDLETVAARDSHQQSSREMPRMFGVEPEVVVQDLHPDFLNGDGVTTTMAVQHHFAHIASCMAENQLENPVLGMAWDGMGYGTDGNLWGGEFLLVTGDSFERVAHLRSFPLPGGEQAMREPRRSALGWCHEILGDSVFEEEDGLPLRHFRVDEKKVLRQMLEKKIGAPETTSVGRLFDAVASLLGLRQISSFEGQAAMDLEFLADHEVEASYSVQLVDSSPLILDTEPILLGILKDLREDCRPEIVAARFLNTLVECAVAVAERMEIETVALSGGCFQNRILTERLVRRLREEGFQPYWHRRVPPNDGGIALGQVAVAAWRFPGSKNSDDASAGKCETKPSHVSSHTR